MTSLGQPPAKYAWKYNDIVALDQVPPVQNTWYTVLDTTLDVRIDYIWSFQENDETDTKNIETRLTVDGETVNQRTAGTSEVQNDDTWYHNYIGHTDIKIDSAAQSMERATGIATAGTPDLDQGLPLFAQSAKVEVRMTSVAGTNQELRARVRYYTLEET